MSKDTFGAQGEGIVKDRFIGLLAALFNAIGTVLFALGWLTSWLIRDDDRNET